MNKYKIKLIVVALILFVAQFVKAQYFEVSIQKINSALASRYSTSLDNQEDHLNGLHESYSMEFNEDAYDVQDKTVDSKPGLGSLLSKVFKHNEEAASHSVNAQKNSDVTRPRVDGQLPQTSGRGAHLENKGNNPSEENKSKVKKECRNSKTKLAAKIVLPIVAVTGIGIGVMLHAISQSN